MEKLLSERLRDQGFVLVLGHEESCQGRAQTVRKGTPYKYDINQGILAVYDENGDPWVREIFGSTVAFKEIVLQYHLLQKGAYVPFSNDGKKFFRELVESRK